MTDVFISYKKEDLARVEPIARALAQAGFDVWWDHRIPPGRTYRDVIGAALQTAKCVIVVWSHLSIKAQWVLDEADEGKKRDVLLPLLIDDVDIPYGFRQIEAARLVGWRGDNKHGEWQDVLSSVGHFVGRAPGGPPRSLARPSAPTPAARAYQDSAPRKQGGGLAVPLLSVIAIAAVASAAYFAWDSGAFDRERVVAEQTAPIQAPVTEAEAEPAPQTTPRQSAPQQAPVQEPAPSAPSPSTSVPEPDRSNPVPAAGADSAPRRRAAEVSVMLPSISQSMPTPGTCRSGFVWREARGSDRVCVTPSSRDRVRQENQTASSRVNPNGEYGPQTCLSGYVWREAFNGDTVCVTPDIRSFTLQENSLAPSRTY